VESEGRHGKFINWNQNSVLANEALLFGQFVYLFIIYGLLTILTLSKQTQIRANNRNNTKALTSQRV